MTRAADWVSAHLFYHGDLDLMLAELVAPLATELAADSLCDQYFFIRYWDGGNHLRLRLLAPPGAHGDVRRRVTERAGWFFQERPSLRPTDQADYRTFAAQLARWEGVSDYAHRPYPDNSVAFIPYRREYLRYGRGRSIDAVERHFVEASQIALMLIRAGLSPGQRDTAALSFILLTWFCAEVEPAHLPPLPPGLEGLADAEARYQRQRDTLRRLAARMQCIAHPDGADAGGAFAAWIQSVARLRATLGDSPTVFRILDTCAHLVCNRLGVAPLDEAYLRYLATRALAAHGSRCVGEPRGAPLR